MADQNIDITKAHGTVERLGRITPWVLAAVSLLPLWLFRYVPGVDYPIHIATGRILVDVMTDQSLSDLYYQFNGQPTPYWLTYILLVPLVYFFGADIGGAILLTAIGLGIFSAIWNLIRVLKLSPVCMIPAVCWLYGASFFWGFLTSLVALPFILWAGVFLLRYQAGRSRFDLILAMTCGCLTGLSNILMAFPLLGIVLAWLLMDVRENWRSALWVVAAAMLPIVPWVIQLIGNSFLGDSGPPLSVRLSYALPGEMVFKIDQNFRIFDSGVGYAAMWAMLVLMLVNIVIGVRQSRQNVGNDTGTWLHTNRFGVSMFCISVFIYLVTPIGIWTGTDIAWGINFRYFIFIGFALLLLGPQRIQAGPARRLHVFVGVLMTVTACIYLGALFSFWAAYDRSIRDLEPVFDAMAPGRSVVMAHTLQRFGSAWPPVEYHGPSYYVARKGGVNNEIFNGGHAPIKKIRRLDAEYEDYSSLRLGEFDYMLVQKRAPIPLDAAPIDGVLSAETDHWKLFSKKSAAP